MLKILRRVNRQEHWKSLSSIWKTYTTTYNNLQPCRLENSDKRNIGLITFQTLRGSCWIKTQQLQVQLILQGTTTKWCRGILGSLLEVIQVSYRKIKTLWFLVFKVFKIANSRNTQPILWKVKKGKINNYFLISKVPLIS